jgi:CheY-like chemotaxis protein
MDTPPRQRNEVGILVVEDEAVVRSAITRVLEGAGYRVLQARDAGEALATLAERTSVVAAVVSDVAMPEVSGERLGTIVARLWPGMPILFISGQAYEGGGRFLAKPFSPEQLVSAVQQILGLLA